MRFVIVFFKQKNGSTFSTQYKEMVLFEIMQACALKRMGETRKFQSCLKAKR